MRGCPRPAHLRRHLPFSWRLCSRPWSSAGMRSRPDLGRALRQRDEDDGARGALLHPSEASLFFPGATDQLAFRSTSSTAAGCFAMTASSTRVGASGCDLPCSQFLNVAGGKPNLVANCAWLSPLFSRTFRTSTSGTWTSVTRTLSFSPLVHSIASFNPWIMLSPTVCGVRARVLFFTADVALVFVVISDFPYLPRVPVSSAALSESSIGG